MARKSRKHLSEPTLPKPISPYKYIVGGYIRISESGGSSIDTQKSIIQSYVDENPDMTLKGFYIDDGKSSFLEIRHAFHKMMSDVENNVINCIIVKDISRFGRDDIEVAGYMQLTFPKHGTRFIAITDGYDSCSDAENLDYSFLLKNLVNYAYSKDISSNVRSVIKLKQDQGTYIGAYLPYGYKKEKAGRETRYAIDKNAADIVRNVYLWASQGDSAYIIASRLNSQNIQSPGEYRKQTPVDPIRQGIWTRGTVMAILRNKTYTGLLEMGKTRTNPKQMRKPVRVAESDWILSYGHHDPIIDMELFQKVQQILNSRATVPTGNKRVLAGSPYLGNRLFCCDCGRKMKRRVQNGKVYYICPRYMESKMACTAKRVSEEELTYDVYDSIMMKIEKVKAYCDRQILYEQSLAFSIKHDSLKRNSARLSRDLETLERDKKKRFEAQVNKRINATDYRLVQEIVHKLEKSASLELYEAQSEIECYRRNYSSDSTWINRLLAYEGVDELSADVYNAFIERVLVHNSGIEIIYAHQKYIEHNTSIGRYA